MTVGVEAGVANVRIVSKADIGETVRNICFWSRGLTEFVGRRGELETLERCWDEAASGTPRARFSANPPKSKDS